MRGRHAFVSFYNRGNLGDDLLARALIQRYPGIAFAYIGGDGPARAFADLPNARPWMVLRYADAVLRRLRLRWRVTPRGRLALIRRSGHAIRIGGSIFMERGPWWRALEDDRDLLASGGGFSVLNTNFGPWESPGFLAQYEELLAQAVDVTVRDRSSLQALSALDNVRLAPDLLFATPVPAQPSEDVGVVVSVIDLAHRRGMEDRRDAYEDAVADLVEDLVRTGRVVTLMSFCSYEGDVAAAERILARVTAELRPQVGRHYYEGDVPSALAVLAGAEAILATRFHAMVLGLAFGRPVACVAYSGKSADALADLGLADLVQGMDEFIATPREARCAWLLGATGRLPEGVAERAEAHFDVLDQVLTRS